VVEQKNERGRKEETAHQQKTILILGPIVACEIQTAEQRQNWLKSSIIQSGLLIGCILPRGATAITDWLA